MVFEVFIKMFVLMSLFLFITSEQSFIMVVSLIFLVLLLSIMLFSKISKFWMFMFIFLIYLGGVLVLFLYVTSLNFKKKFVLENKKWVVFLMLPLFTVFFKKSSFEWFSENMSILFMMKNEMMMGLVFILFVLLICIIFISLFLPNFYSPFRNL